MNQPELADRILAFLHGEGISFSEQQARLCARHVLLMLEWNRRLNLTRITDIEEILTKHVLDSLLPTRFLPSQGKALDIGSGAGFPGIPIKIAHPGLSVVLLEAQRKKASFLKVVLAALQMDGIHAVQARWEEHVRSTERGGVPQYDLVTMRALRLPPAQFTAVAGGALRRGGVIAWWAGPGEDERSMQSYHSAVDGLAIEFAGCHAYRLPGLTKPRQVCIWKRVV